MAGWEVIGTDVKEYKLGTLALMLNEQNGTNYPTLAAGITSLGIGVVTTSVFSRYVFKIRDDISDLLASVGIAITLTGIVAMLEDNSDKLSLRSALNMAVANNGTVTFTTKTYQWVSGSGNSYTWKTETTYKYNKY